MQSSVPVAFPSQVFNEIRNEHFSNVFGFLSQKARNLQAQYDVRLLPGASVCFLGGSQAAASLMLLLGRDWGGPAGVQWSILCEDRRPDFSGTSPQRRRGMDIKQMKNFVSQELKGLKQEHRLLSLRTFQLEARVRGGLQRSSASGRRSCSSIK